MDITRQKVESGYSYRDGVWSGGEPNHEKLCGNLGDVLYRKLYERRNEIFQIDSQTKTHQTCNEIRDHAINFSIYLKYDLKVNVGDVIALCADNDKYSIILVLASIYLGLPIFCIDPAFEQDEISRLIEIMKPTVLVCEKEYLFKFENLQIKHKLEKNDNFYENYLSLSKLEEEFSPESVYPAEAVILYMCTSGFTGLRRIVPYTKKSFVLSCNLSNAVTCLNIYTEHLMYICSNPKLENYPHTRKLRLIWSRGTPIPTEQMKFIRSVFPCTHIVNCYACVEFGGYVTSFDPTYEYDMNIMKINSVGRLRRGCEAKIVDIETRKLLGSNQYGELLVKTMNMPNKYYSLNIETDYTEDGWYTTGDYAKFDEEQCLYVVSPHDIEYIITRMPTVRSCVVIGIPDPVLGELLVAFVVKERDTEVTEKEIVKTVALEGKEYQRLRGGVHFISQLPSSVAGSISRKEWQKLMRMLSPKNCCMCGQI